MDKITRYLILVFIFIIFCALAPLIIIYVSGRGLNFSDSQNGTGILDVQTLPKNAQVLMDGKLTDTTPTTIRFVKQGTYDIQIKKEGYHTWIKKLFIEAGKVTYAGTLDEAIKLLPDSAPQLVSDQNVKTALTIENQIIYVTEDNTLTVYNVDQKAIVKQSKITLNIASLNSTQNNNVILAKTIDNNYQLVDVKTLKLSPLPNQFSSAQNIEVISNTNLIFQNNNKLYSYDITTKAAPKLIMDNVNAFTLSENLIYTAKTGPNSIGTYFWDGKTLTPQDIIIGDDFSFGRTSKLFLTSHKELFLQTDRSLYRINAKPELINNQIELVNFNPYRQELTFSTPTEVYFYNFESSQSELFYRSSKTISQAIVVPELGYGFISSDNEVKAIEIDNRNGQNQYSLIKDAPTALTQLTGNENQLVTLVGRKLYTLTVK